MTFRSPAPLTHAILALPGHGSPCLGDLLQLEPPAWGRGLPAEALTSAALFQATRPGPSWRKRILTRGGKRRGRGSWDSWLREARSRAESVTLGGPSAWGCHGPDIPAAAGISEVRMSIWGRQGKLGPLVPASWQNGGGGCPVRGLGATWAP